ncbi:TetR/AcrR family transcriptional regulator [Aquabacter sp. P-9]|uniref:TetR/AcrR family transcriptional regulator n=1 Tax=Aquabacter sediminis TaxID=3029197 RepID=UPI00237D5B4C|nr:TetR/AcrR family transcriptional regulator [Aquabacter sp. P-9]MDE1568743.1 TetR/AcrR family transcriptional regulator [Aquabacter sp. P-9]
METRDSPAAGQDPEKRRQILDGARQVFFERGFDAASMGDIARAAGVSKGTLYVYFEDKVDLFASLVTHQCDGTAERTFHLEASGLDLATALTRLGTSYLEMMVLPCNVAILRTVIAIAGKFPEIGRRFLEAGPMSGNRRVAAFLKTKVDQGLLEIEDLETAASQFLLLCKDGVMTPILLGGSEETPSPEQIETSARRAATFFLRAYGTRAPCGAGEKAPAAATG